MTTAGRYGGHRQSGIADRNTPASILEAGTGLQWQQRKVVVDGRHVNYVDAGSGEPAVLLLHGIGASHRIWQTTMPALAAVRRVVAIDLPGFGASDSFPVLFGARQAADHIGSICDALGLGQVDLVGHSMGGMIAMQVVASSPDRIGRLALISSSLTTIMKFYCHPVAGFVLQPRVCSRFIGQMAVASLPVSPRLVRSVVSSPRLRRLACRNFLAESGAVDSRVLLDVLISSASGRTLSAALMGFRFDFPGAAAAVAARNRETLLISGAGDRFVGAGDMEVFADLVGPHELAIVRDAGHWPMIEQPRAVIHILKSWLTEPADREDL